MDPILMEKDFDNHDGDDDDNNNNNDDDVV